MSEVMDVPVLEKPRKPNWLRVKLPIGEEYKQVRKIVDEHKLHTICESGMCATSGCAAAPPATTDRTRPARRATWRRCAGAR